MSSHNINYDKNTVYKVRILEVPGDLNPPRALETPERP